MTKTKPLAALISVGLVLSACGSSESTETETTDDTTETTADSAGTEETTETTEEASSSTEASVEGDAGPDEEAAGPELTDEEQAAANAWALVFNSATAIDKKTSHLAEVETLTPTLEAYAATGDEVGGIELAPTDVTLEGETAVITYDINFGGNPTYSDQSGTIELIDGTWIVSRESFCGFMSTARVNCEAA